MSLPDSTVAMSAYNAITLGACTLDEVAARLASYGFAAPRTQVERALAKLKARGYVLGDAFLAPVDPQRRLLRRRDRSDVSGPDPGWSGWCLQDARGRIFRLDTIVKQRGGT